MTTSTSGIPSVFSTHEIAIISTALNLVEEKRIKSTPVQGLDASLACYMRLRFAGLTNEQGHVLYLDINRKLICAETEFFGSQSRVDWDMRKVVGRAINVGAEFLVFAHNHPGGNEAPSETDIQHMIGSERVLKLFNITLIDSLVVTSGSVTSIKLHREWLEENRLQEYRERAKQESKERAERKAARMAERTKKMEAVFGNGLSLVAA